MKWFLLLLITLPASFGLKAQTDSSTEVILIDSLWTKGFFQLDSSVFIAPTPPPFINYPSYQFDIPYTVFVWTPQCGVTKHGNGRIASKAACVNGVLHGKTTYWDDNGRKTSESYYLKGSQISSKNWDEKGRMTQWINYNGKGDHHGKYYSFDPENHFKVTTSYFNGTEHGKHLEYDHEKLTVCDVYKKGELVDHTTYFSNGRISSHSHFVNGIELTFADFYENGSGKNTIIRDSSGAIISKVCKNEKGTIYLAQYYQNGRATGVWIDGYDALTDTKTTTEYRENAPLEKLVKKGNQVIHKTLYNKGTIACEIRFFEDGDTSSLFRPGLKNYQKTWDVAGNVVEEFYYLSSGLLTEKGYFTVQDTTYCYDLKAVTPQQQYSIPVWVVYRGDTLRMDYVLNNKEFYKEYNKNVLVRNHFVQDPETGLCEEHGVWTYYSGKQISEVITFVNGKREGWTKRFSVGENPTLLESGSYENDKREGKWIMYTPDGELVLTYTSDKATGPFTKYNRSYDLRIRGYLADSVIVGPFMEYYENDQIKSTVNYLNGKEYGLKKTYYADGSLMSKGYVFNNTQMGKWIIYDRQQSGKLKRRKVNFGRNTECKKLKRELKKEVFFSQGSDDHQTV